MRGARLLPFIYSQVWAIDPEIGSQMLGVVHRWAMDHRLSDDEIRIAIAESGHAPQAAVPGSGQQSSGGVAVIKILGVISARSEMVADSSLGGGMSAETISKRFQSAMSDPEVSSIVFDIESPGGAVFGIPELAVEIMKARETKHVYAIANSMAASAAYWIGSAAGTFVATPSAQVGSIGVYSAHEDLSKAMETAGVKVSMVSYGEYKTERNPFEPLNDTARAHMQSLVDAYGKQFEKAVADGRGVASGVVRESFGQGRTFGAQEAKSRGMIDKIATLDEVIAEAKMKKRAPYPKRAAASARLAIS